MAIFPCDWTGHRYPGPQRSLYVTSARSGEVTSWKMRLCPTHFREQFEHVSEHAALVDAESKQSDNCENCHEEKHVVVFFKLYDEQGDPVEYATDLCARCWDTLGKTLKVSNGRPL